MIFADQCVACHGSEGQGDEDHYPPSLSGDATIAELSRLIAGTMPEEDPDACVAEDAEAVASFMHDAFYSEAARVRRRPPRVVLARLTGDQLRQSLADLYGRFLGDPWVQPERGLQANYFDGGRWDKKKLKFERADPVIDFDFGNEGPGKGVDPNGFYIHWGGSLKVMETGRYQIIVRSTCAFTLGLGHKDRQLINNHVQSEGREEFRESLQLTAGRCYPIEINLFQRKRKTEQPPARFTLSWVPPGGVEEVLPNTNLIPRKFPASFALQAKLPPDDRSYGYERGTAINRTWDDSTTAAAVEFAQFAVDELYPNYLGNHREEGNENRAQLRGFLTDLVTTAFRRPLDPSMQIQFVDRLVDRVPNDGDAIKLVTIHALKSPRFLYPTLDQDRRESHRIGSRLALTLYDSLPSDQWLRDWIDKDRFTDSRKINAAARRMVNDYRCQAKTRDFLYQWLGLANMDEITKDQTMYPGFDARLVADLKTSLDAFLTDVVYSENSDFRQLLRANWMFTNDRMANFYGDGWQVRKDQSKVVEVQNVMNPSVSNSTVHVGVLTHPLLLSEFAYHRTSSPIHRGVFLTRHTLGRVLRPPNAAFSPLNPDLHPGLTTRQRVDLQTGEVSCQVCHSKINAVGFALEHFDAVGRYRNSELGKPIDASGGYVSRQGESVNFSGARQLGDYLASSNDCHRSFVETAFEAFVKQPIAAYGPERLDSLTERFQDSGFNIRQLIVSIAEIASVPVPTGTVQNPDGI